MSSTNINTLYNKYDYYFLSGTALVVLGVGTIFYHNVEHWNWLDSVYFCAITLTTIGYGDFVPKTDLAKAFTIFYVIIGISILGAFVQAFLKRAAVKQKERIRRRLGERKIRS